MTLEQLRIFIAVAEREHVTQAAQVLGLTQSAVSAAVSTLEARYDTHLFHRVGRRIELSDAGRQFLPEAKAILQQVGAAELTLAELSGLKRGTLSVQASQTVASYWLPAHLVRYRKAYPKIDIQLSIGNTAQVAASINTGAAELGFVEGAVDEPALVSAVVDHDQLVVVVGRRHPWFKRRRAKVSLLETDWVLREAGSGTRSTFETALARSGLSFPKLSIVMILPSNEAVRAAVVAGTAATAISRSVVAASIDSGELAEIPFDMPAREYVVLARRERFRSRAASAFLNLISLNGRPTVL